MVWAIALSLATTDAIDFSFFSTRYLDVSVPWVGHAQLWIHCALIRVSRDQLAFDQSPGLFAVFHALHRLLAPRHPPHALSSLTALIDLSPDLRLKEDDHSVSYDLTLRRKRQNRQWLTQVL